MCLAQGLNTVTPERLEPPILCGTVNIQSNISYASPKHYFRDVFRVQTYSEEQPVCHILLPLSSFSLLNILECHFVILLNFYGVMYTQTPSLGVPLKSVTA